MRLEYFKEVATFVSHTVLFFAFFVQKQRKVSLTKHLAYFSESDKGLMCYITYCHTSSRLFCTLASPKKIGRLPYH